MQSHGILLVRLTCGATKTSEWCMQCGETELVIFMFWIPQMLPSLTQALCIIPLLCLQHQAWRKRDWQIPQLLKVKVAVQLQLLWQRMAMAKEGCRQNWRESPSQRLELANQKLSVNNVEKHLVHPVLLQNINLHIVMKENMFVVLVGKDSSARIICKWIWSSLQSIFYAETKIVNSWLNNPSIKKISSYKIVFLIYLKKQILEFLWKGSVVKRLFCS